MKVFRQQLAASQPESSTEPSQRRWIYVPYDQLSDRIGPLAQARPSETGIVLIESSAKAARRPYHRQKLALILANQRHFAIEQANRGIAVRYSYSSDGYREALEQVIAEVGPVEMMEAAERELRQELAPLVESSALQVLPHAGWLTSHEQFVACRDGSGCYRMDAFYRRVRRDSGLLMEDGKPLGGRFSHDGDNRKPWSGEPRAPEPLRFEVDEVTREVGQLIEERFSDHPGVLDLGALPATAVDASRLWRWALDNCLTDFGPYEDAMSTRSSGIFHTRISMLLNLHRLVPSQVVSDVVALEAPLSSREGFLRQVLGWREFVRWVHLATDGFRDLEVALEERESSPGSGEGARPSFLGSNRPLPPAFWGEKSGLECLDHVVEDVWREGYSHHITRLMVLSNLGTLLDISPRELTDWFWVAYTDAYDWVVEPNVLGMGTFAAGDLMTTKPYVSGSNYIDKMSDYCSGCRFDPKRTCPITPLYWGFLERHREKLSGNPRMNLVMGSLKRRSDEKKENDRKIFEWVSRGLADGEQLRPEDSPSS